ncbi:SMC-Scp complex subunit ScpB [Microbacterium sp. W4I20]|uniref:SMC-Scp complex subunit ScpB n=1 Tax=Microbacterium sp. W4I20 TaxID=3042262 RepID=UPI00277F5000|nr:SMC-Scp complex subunit ScpB [Microbacterium sp. W4I20]MDQ0725011.1 segregation and condensation protein B [Microbacterium sp. W4I20]
MTNDPQTAPEIEGDEPAVERTVEPTTPLTERLEAILLIVDEPIGLMALAAAVGSPVPAVRQSLETLVDDYDGRGQGPRRGFELREVGGGWRLYVREDHDDLVAEFIGGQAPARLSQAALETLAVIAYKQPVTRSQVASIRAVNVDSVVRTLLARGLITELFADSETGAINYGTSDALLQHLGINSLDELPPISPLLDDGADGFDEGVIR